MIKKRNSFADKESKEDIDTGVRMVIQAERREFLTKAREKFAGMGAGVMHSDIMIKIVFIIDKLLEVNERV